MWTDSSVLIVYSVLLKFVIVVAEHETWQLILMSLIYQNILILEAITQKL